MHPLDFLQLLFCSALIFCPVCCSAALRGAGPWPATSAIEPIGGRESTRDRLVACMNACAGWSMLNRTSARKPTLPARGRLHEKLQTQAFARHLCYRLFIILAAL